MEAQCTDGTRAGGIAHRRDWREARLARGGIREHDAFLGRGMRDLPGTERGGVLLGGGKVKVQGVKRLRQIGAEMI